MAWEGINGGAKGYTSEIMTSSVMPGVHAGYNNESI